jgi:hypothetical protein
VKRADEKAGQKSCRSKWLLQGQYMFECIVSESKTPFSNTFVARTVEKRFL